MQTKNYFWPDYIVLALGFGLYYFFPGIDMVLMFTAITYSVVNEAILAYKLYSKQEAIKQNVYAGSVVKYWYVGFITLCYFSFGVAAWSHLLDFKMVQGEGIFSLIFLTASLQAFRFVYDELNEDLADEHAELPGSFDTSDSSEPSHEIAA